MSIRCRYRYQIESRSVPFKDTYRGCSARSPIVRKNVEVQADDLAGCPLRYRRMQPAENPGGDLQPLGKRCS